ncbi:hypothetical protein N7535_004056 [Penicillium sp. DV-2018c]|nr:hypothetical protein N7535_004056 [Penicillium sp. DV-2018c]
MADFEANEPLQETAEWHVLHLSECLEDRHIKHCIAGDAVLTTLNHPLVIIHLYLAVADEQLEDALSVMLQQGLEKRPGRDTYVEKDATIAPLGWPGYTLQWPLAPSHAIGVSLVPSSFWHLDLSEATLISSLVELTLEPGHNRSIARYLQTQYHYLVNWLSWQSPGILLNLPPCDKFFVDLYGVFLPPDARPKIYLNRQRIQLGLITAVDASQEMPTKFIETIKKIETIRKEKMRREAAEVAEAT